MTVLAPIPVDLGRHYVLHPECTNWWFNACLSRVSRYESRFSDDFCFVLARRKEPDGYVIPWPIARRVFDASVLNVHGRWVGTVIHDELRVVNGRHRRSFPIGRFRNAYEFLDLFAREHRQGAGA